MRRARASYRPDMRIALLPNCGCGTHRVLRWPPKGPRLTQPSPLLSICPHPLGGYLVPSEVQYRQEAERLQLDSRKTADRVVSSDRVLRPEASEGGSTKNILHWMPGVRGQ